MGRWGGIKPQFVLGWRTQGRSLITCTTTSAPILSFLFIKKKICVSLPSCYYSFKNNNSYFSFHLVLSQPSDFSEEPQCPLTVSFSIFSLSLMYYRWKHLVPSLDFWTPCSKSLTAQQALGKDSAQNIYQPQHVLNNVFICRFLQVM